MSVRVDISLNFNWPDGVRPVFPTHTLAFAYEGSTLVLQSASQKLVGLVAQFGQIEFVPTSLKSVSYTKWHREIWRGRLQSVQSKINVLGTNHEDIICKIFRGKKNMTRAVVESEMYEQYLGDLQGISVPRFHGIGFDIAGWEIEKALQKPLTLQAPKEESDDENSDVGEGPDPRVFEREGVTPLACIFMDYVGERIISAGHPDSFESLELEAR